MNECHFRNHSNHSDKDADLSKIMQSSKSREYSDKKIMQSSKCREYSDKKICEALNVESILIKNYAKL